MRRCLVLCRDLNEKRYNIDCFKAPDGKYYSSEDAYNDIANKKRKINEDRNRCINTIADVLGYDNAMPMPTITYKKMEELSSYGYDVIEETIKLNRNAIEWAIEHKTFKSEVNKIQYVFAIIQNNCKETLDIVRRQEKNKARNNVNDIDVNDTEMVVNRKQNVKDISKWLEDD